MKELRHDQPHARSAPHFVSRVPLEDALAIIEITENELVHYDTILYALAGREALSKHYWRRASSIGIGVKSVRSLRHALAILGLQRIRAIAISLRDQALEERARQPA